MYPKNHEHFKSSKPRVQFYCFLQKKSAPRYKHELMRPSKDTVTVLYPDVSSYRWIGMGTQKINPIFKSV